MFEKLIFLIVYKKKGNYHLIRKWWYPYRTAQTTRVFYNYTVNQLINSKNQNFE